ncbi:hypothetical protein V5O48_003368 [Marasmius crinis-equi]|uniref:Uncharacterized protein n=1 Tax=Marasmius crinis-equi TaxID=585013 RepID=A0ABR3FT27_9AGAR
MRKEKCLAIPLSHLVQALADSLTEMAFATQWDSSATLESMDAKTFVLKSQDCTVKSLGSCHRGSSFLSSVTSAEQDDDEKAANSSAESLAPLPPQDRGLHAWGYLMSAWVLDFLIWFVLNIQDAR